MKHARQDYQGRIIDTEGLIPDDEPVMLFRAQDRHFVDVLRAYRSLLARDADARDDIKDAVVNHIELAKDWQHNHGSKTPDLPQETDSHADA